MQLPMQSICLLRVRRQRGHACHKQIVLFQPEVPHQETGTSILATLPLPPSRELPWEEAATEEIIIIIINTAMVRVRVRSAALGSKAGMNMLGGESHTCMRWWIQLSKGQGCLSSWPWERGARFTILLLQSSGGKRGPRVKSFVHPCRQLVLSHRVKVQCGEEIITLTRSPVTWRSAVGYPS